MTVAARDEPAELELWDAITHERPQLKAALYIAQQLRRRSPGSCANLVWYWVLKPVVERNVGWGSEPRCPGHLQSVADLVNNVPIEHDEKCRAAWRRQEWLQQSDAYDLVYEMIYNALPDCQHELGACRG